MIHSIGHLIFTAGVQVATFMRKQLDPRIPILINNNVKKNHRSFIVLVGDKGRDQVSSSLTRMKIDLSKFCRL